MSHKRFALSKKLSLVLASSVLMVSGAVLYLVPHCPEWFGLATTRSKAEQFESGDIKAHTNNWIKHRRLAAEKIVDSGYYMDERRNEAESQLWQSLHEAELCDPDGKMVAISSYDLAHFIGLDSERGQFLLERAMSIWQKEFGPDQVKIADQFLYMANQYMQFGDSERAKPLYLRALALRSAQNDLQVAEILVGLVRSLPHPACTQWNSASIFSAESYLKRALSIRSKLLPKDDPAIAEILYELATVPSLDRDHSHSGNSVERYDARDLYTQAMNIWRKAGHGYERNVALCLDGMAHLRSNDDLYNRRKAFYDTIVDRAEKHLRCDVPSKAAGIVDRCLELLNQRLWDSDRLSCSENLCKQELNLLEKTYGSNDPDLARCLMLLSSLYCEDGDTTNSNSCQERASAICSKQRSWQVVDMLNNLSELSDAKRQKSWKQVVMTLQNNPELCQFTSGTTGLLKNPNNNNRVRIPYHRNSLSIDSSASLYKVDIDRSFDALMNDVLPYFNSAMLLAVSLISGALLLRTAIHAKEQKQGEALVLAYRKGLRLLGFLGLGTCLLIGGLCLQHTSVEWTSYFLENLRLGLVVEQQYPNIYPLALEQNSGSLACLLTLLLYVLATLSSVLCLSQIIVSRQGISFALDWFKPLRIVAKQKWDEIEGLALSSAREEDVNYNPFKQSLRFSLKWRYKARIELVHFRKSEIASLLSAIKKLCSNPELDSNITEIENFLGLSGSTQPSEALLTMSQTEMWEEQMNSCFLSTSFLPLSAGTQLQSGRLTVEKLIGSGGTSAIYRCRANDGTIVILKEAVVKKDRCEQARQKAEELFAREAEILAKLHHQKIARLIDFFNENGRDYLVVEHIEGINLRQFVAKNGPVGETVVLNWGMQIAEILHYLHHNNPPIVHRDITPDNLLIKDDGSIILIDFGAANEFVSQLTGTLVGKQSYIAPEQFRGKAEPQSDIYALGATLHFLLTGSDPVALSRSHPKLINAEVSQEADALVANCTEIETAKRMGSADQLFAQLELTAKCQTQETIVSTRRPESLVLNPVGP